MAADTGSIPVPPSIDSLAILSTKKYGIISPSHENRRSPEMAHPRILVIDGNRAATRAQQVAAGGQPSGEGYARVLQSLAEVSCDIVRPADGEVRFAPGTGLSDYAGVAITGSALNIYDGGVHIERQIELARAVFAVGMAFFGS